MNTYNPNGMNTKEMIINQMMNDIKDKCPSSSIPLIRTQLEKLAPNQLALVTVPDKSPIISLVLSLVAGGFGVDRFFIGDIGFGVAKLVTSMFGIGLILVVIDYFMIMDATKKKNLENIQNSINKALQTAPIYPEQQYAEQDYNATQYADQANVDYQGYAPTDQNYVSVDPNYQGQQYAQQYGVPPVDAGAPAPSYQPIAPPYDDNNIQ